MVRNRLKPVALCEDIIKQAFLQVPLKEADRDTFRFHWIRAKDSSQVETFRFKRTLFGLLQSAFPLKGTLQQHLQT